jgi:hypothetical protein
MKRIQPKEMADKIVKLLRKQHPDPSYVKKIFQYGSDRGNIRYLPLGAVIV